MEQFVVYANQSILYSSTGMFTGSVTGSILYNWLIPNCNTDQHIGIAMLVRSTCVSCRKGLGCGGYGRIILGGDEEVLVFCTGLLGLVLVCGGVVPTAV